MGKMTKARRNVLLKLDARPADVHDLADAVGVSADVAFIELQALRRMGWVDWMYPDDQASLTPAGRSALEEHNGKPGDTP